MAYSKSAVSSQQIIDAAIRVLARQGYARTSLLEIAKEAGMSKGALHYHYPTKEALIHAVLEAACNVVQARTVQAWSPSDNPFEALRKSLEELWATRAERTDEASVVAELIALILRRIPPPQAGRVLRARRPTDSRLSRQEPGVTRPRTADFAQPLASSRDRTTRWFGDAGIRRSRCVLSGRGGRRSADDRDLDFRGRLRPVSALDSVRSCATSCKRKASRKLRSHRPGGRRSIGLRIAQNTLSVRFARLREDPLNRLCSGLRQWPG